MSCAKGDIKRASPKAVLPATALESLCIPLAAGLNIRMASPQARSKNIRQQSHRSSALFLIQPKTWWQDESKSFQGLCQSCWTPTHHHTFMRCCSPLSPSLYQTTYLLEDIIITSCLRRCFEAKHLQILEDIWIKDRLNKSWYEK